ncbi:hypothetical protein GCM10009069_24350 [Algimonas arctica]|uniref:Uncharacterized protein n=1 Tax=Algimonas arctica TaxID=1479486 RepID=A0A8J3CRV4_9PROT|nr:CpcT/CpeT family chromophore lyase [Algimonas arctica]GHB00617.1 hypothetical protein GCM10009069_24350 [Algimonas arctica]
MKSFANLSNLAIVAFFLAGCATTPVESPTAPTDPAAQLATRMVGTYQAKSAKIAADIVRETRVKLDPLGAGQWIYTQINEGPSFDKVSQQRVLSLRSQPDGRVIQASYSIISPSPYQAMGNKLSALTRAQLRPELGEGCDMIWVEMPHGWSGQVDPSRCVIVSPTQRGELRMGARTEIIGNRLRRAETGYDLDGIRLWGSEDGEWTVLFRAP